MSTITLNAARATDAAGPDAQAKTSLRTVIESLGIYLPPKAVSTADVLRGCTNPVTFPLEQMTGIHSRRMAGDEEFAIDLARKAVADCLASSRHAPADIDLLVCCNISRYDGPGHRFTYEPCTAITLRREFGFDNAYVFDISNACAGMFTAIYLIDALLKAGAIRRGMAVSGEYITHLTRTAQREISGFLDPRLSCLTVGDAGAAVILEQAGGPGIGFEAIDLYTLGAHGRHCTARATDKPHGGAIMLTDPVSITTVAIKHGTAHASRTLRSHAWHEGPVDHLIMHQTSETALRGALKELGTALGASVCGGDKAIINLGERGNTATTTHLVALHDHVMNGRIRSGDCIVFGISGSGQTVGTALYTLDDLPDRLRRKAEGAPAHSVLRRDLPQATKRCAGVRIESVGTPAGLNVAGAGTLGLVRTAADDCFQRSEYTREEVELLIFAGVYRSEFLSEPAVAALAAGELGLNADGPATGGPRTFAFDLVNGGVGFLNACHMATELIRAGKHSVAMVAAAEVENNRPGGPAAPIGIMETGSAVILDLAPEPGQGFGAFLFKNFPACIDRLSSYTSMAGGQLVMNLERDPQLHEFYLDCIAETVRELLDAEGVSLDDLQVILSPQVAPGFVGKLAQRLGAPEARCVDVTTEAGDLLSSSLPHAMRHALDCGLASSGGLGLVIAVGSGIQVGCVLYRF